MCIIMINGTTVIEFPFFNRNKKKKKTICEMHFYIWVIPNHFNQSFYMTLSELDETWYVSSTYGFMKPDKVSRLVALWLPS